MDRVLELIDRNELIRFFENDADRHKSSLNKYERNYANAMLVAAKNVKVFPGVDAVKVVRCKDCYLGENCTCICCEDGEMVLCRNLNKHMPADAFCSDGWRAEDG